MRRPDTELNAERNAARKVVKALLGAGYVVSINDGEETTVERSADKKELFAALWTTDEDYILAHDKETGKQVGWVYLVYGNGAEDLINDYTTNLESAIRPLMGA